MRKTKSSPNFHPAQSGGSTPIRRVSLNAHSISIPPSPTIPDNTIAITAPLIERLEVGIPTTLYQLAQCSELYGTPSEILSRAPPLMSEDLLKSHAACMLTPDEPPERPLDSLRETMNPHLRLCYERFERLFLSIRRRRRMTI
jgi:hypothetical protein